MERSSYLPYGERVRGAAGEAACIQIGSYSRGKDGRDGSSVYGGAVGDGKKGKKQTSVRKTWVVKLTGPRSGVHGV